MNIRTNIICSECDIDLKDKVAMGETESPKEPNLTIVDIKTKEGLDEKTLADLIKNSQIPTASIVGIPTINSGTFALIQQDTYCHMSEVLRQEWIIPNKNIEKEILEGNERSYIYTSCSLKTPDTTLLVLVEVCKNYYSDGSYKISYKPLTFSQIKRMPE